VVATMSVVLELSGLVFGRQLSVKLLSTLAKDDEKGLMDETRRKMSASARRWVGD
jgi:hypothetical protein